MHPVSCRLPMGGLRSQPNAELSRSELAEHGLYAVPNTPRLVGRSRFGWVSTSRLPLNSEEARTGAELG
jgi:hypothetical protein